MNIEQEENMTKEQDDAGMDALAEKERIEQQQIKAMAQAVKERRLGRFRIDSKFIKDKPELVAVLLKDCIVIRAEMLFEWDGIEYMAYHPSFEPGEEYCRAKEYVINITMERTANGAGEERLTPVKLDFSKGVTSKYIVVDAKPKERG